MEAEFTFINCKCKRERGNWKWLEAFNLQATSNSFLPPARLHHLNLITLELSVQILEPMGDAFHSNYHPGIERHCG